MAWHLQLLRFTGIGGFCTVVQYIIMWLLTELLSIPPVTSSTVGYILSAILNFQLNKKHTFKSNKNNYEAIPRFIIVVLIGVFINGLSLEILIRTLNTHYLIAQIGATLITLIWNFFANRIWTFSVK